MIVRTIYDFSNSHGGLRCSQPVRVLRTLREKLGLTMRDIETSSARMAEKYRNEEFSIPPSRLSDIETKGVLPSIFRIYTLAVIYRRDMRELLSWYGVDMNNMAADFGMIAPPRSHLSRKLSPD
jgi:transcriptional regulator with XRE-family HTH domain